MYRCASKVGDQMGNEKVNESNAVYFDYMVTDIAEGHIDSLSELYNALKKPVFVLALSILQDYYAAEDIMQETFLKVVSHAGEYQQGTNPKAWIFSIARNLCLDAIRKKKNDELTENIPDMNNFEEKAASSIDFLRMIQALKQDEKQIIVMHFYGGLKKVEIAKLMGVPSANIRVTYSRALKKLKNNMK